MGDTDDSEEFMEAFAAESDKAIEETLADIAIKDSELLEALATFDPIAHMAEMDAEIFGALLQEVNTNEVALQELLAALAEDAGKKEDEIADRDEKFFTDLLTVLAESNRTDEELWGELLDAYAKQEAKKQKRRRKKT